MVQELGFLKYLKQARVPVTEYEMPVAKLSNVQERATRHDAALRRSLFTPSAHTICSRVQGQLEKLVSKNYYLHKSARDGYRSYLHAYNSHALKDVYDVGNLDLAAVAASFGFEHPPKVTLMLKANAKEGGRKGSGGGKGGKDKAKAGSGHRFSADNPYGQRESGDARQFAH